MNMDMFTEEWRKNIYLRCNVAPMEQLLQLCLNPETGITPEGLRDAGYRKIDQLEQRYQVQAEEVFWQKAQDSVDLLAQYVEKCEQHVFSGTHLDKAKELIRQHAAAQEAKDWENICRTQDRELLMAFIKKCKDGMYSQSHLQEALTWVERLDWQTAQDSHDAVVMNGYIQKCATGFYLMNHLEEAKALLEKWANGTLLEEWNALWVLKNTDPQKKVLLDRFVQKYAQNMTDTAMEYKAKAEELYKVIEDAEEARKDWINAKKTNTILDYANFLEAHPYSEYREEAEELIRSMKGNLLTDMKCYPFKYSRSMMYEYISTGALTMEDLVDVSHTLTDRAYSHIKRYPNLASEQRALPVSTLENPHSKDGNTDIYFWGIPSSGKTCVLAGLMSLTGRLGFSFDPKGPGGGGHYAMDLRNYARTSMLPPSTEQSYIQVIDGEIDDENGYLRKISLIEMSGEKTARFASINNPTGLKDLGEGAAGLLSNENSKVFFFVIDPTANEKEISLNALGEQPQVVKQSDALDCIASLLNQNPGLMRRVVAIHIILTKSDTLGDIVTPEMLNDILNQQGYQAVLNRIKRICERYDINQTSDNKVGLYPFCVGKFMPGDVYTFDETDSLKILRVIQRNAIPYVNPNKGGIWSSLKEWFNS